MKTLFLIIFLLASSCFAQVGVDSGKGDIQFYIPQLTYTDPAMIRAVKKLALISLVEQWSSYEKECYADSTADIWSREYVNWRPDEKSCVEETTYVYVPRGGVQKKIEKFYFSFIFDGYKYKYSHRQPTPQGFMNYLKRRLGEK